jgi:hypothetical protein
MCQRRCVSLVVLGAAHAGHPSTRLTSILNLPQKEKSKGASVGPVMLGFFLFVVVGSGGLQEGW